MYPPTQKPPDLDASGNPVVNQQDTKPPDLDEYGAPIQEKPSFASQVWHAISDPLTDLPSRAGRAISSGLENLPTMQQTGQGGLGDWAAWADASAKGLFQGSIEGAGDLASSLTSPLNIGTTLATGGSNLALRAGLPTIARGLSTAAKVASLPIIGHGIGRAVTAESIPEAGGGLVEAAMGGSMMGHTPHTGGPILSRLWPEAKPPLETQIPGLLDQLRTSLDKDAARRGEVGPELPRGNLQNVGRLIIKPEKTPDVMETIAKLTNEGFTTESVNDQGHIVMTRNKPTTETPVTPPVKPPVQQDRYPFAEGELTPDQLAPFGHEEPMFSMVPQDPNLLHQQQAFQEGRVNEGLPDLRLEAGKRGPEITNRDMIEKSNEIAQPEAPRPFEEQVLPWDIQNEFRKDITQTNEPVPELGPEATTPKFDEQVMGPSPDESYEEPLFAKIGEGRAKIDVNVKRAAEELTSGYSHPLPSIMVREGLQNSLDATSKLGMTGRVKVTAKSDYDTQGNKTKFLEVTDNGKGMSPEELYTVYTNLHETGKIGEEGAKGGKGVGKAPFMLGGSHFSVETVKDVNGQKVRSWFEGTPEQLLQGFDVNSEVVEPSTPTGTKFRTVLKPEQDDWHIDNMFEQISKYSRDTPTQIDYENWRGNNTHLFKSSSDDRMVIQNEPVDNGNSEINVGIPSDAVFGPKDTLEIKVLNNGMYQFRRPLFLGEETPGMPDKIILNIKPKVEEGSDAYPFPVQRESIKETIAEEIDKIIKDKFVNPFANNKKKDLAKLWSQMATTKSTTTGREVVFFDPGNRLTPDEHDDFVTHPVVGQISNLLDGLVDAILRKSGYPKWGAKVERVGITLDPNMYGVHIPNPMAPKDAPKSAILINPFVHIESPLGSMTPRDAALDMVVTALHESAHVGSENPQKLPPISETDINDPRVGRYLKTYMQQVMSQGGLDMGHGMQFVHRLGDVYAKFGTQHGLNYATHIENVLSDPSNPGRYRPEVERLLHLYTESRGRAAVTEDILSGTGVKSGTIGTGPGNVSGDTSGLGGGASTIYVRKPTIDTVKEAIRRGYKFSGEVREDGAWKFVKGGTGKVPLLEHDIPISKAKPEPKKPADIGLPRQAYDLARGLMSVDPPFMTSAAFRQAMPWVGTTNWFKSWVTAAKSFGSETAYQVKMKEISESPLFRPRPAKGKGMKEQPSFAHEIGLRMTDLQDARSARMEGIKAQLAERIPVYGRYVKASNRAFSSFLNDLRAKNLEAFVKDGKALAKAHEDPSLDLTQNIPLAKEFAELLNDTTGAGSLKTGFGKHQYSLEQHASKVADVFFSPRLMASRVRMLNPSTYIMANPAVRKQYINAMLRTVGAWWGVAQLGKLAGGQVSTDPNNPDFGKIKIGNTRIDPGAGFQQFLVLGSRIKPDWAHIPMEPTETGILPIDFTTALAGSPGGTYSSSISGINREFGVGYNPPTRASNTINFLTNKLHPTAKLIYDIAAANERQPVYLGDRILQLYLPMMAGDLAELMQESPELIPLVLPLTGGGMGSQTYTGEPDKPAFIPEDYDIQIGGKRR